MKHLYLVHKARALYDNTFCKVWKVTEGIIKFGAPKSAPHLKTSNHLCIFQGRLDYETVRN